MVDYGMLFGVVGRVWVIVKCRMLLRVFFRLMVRICCYIRMVFWIICCEEV